MSEECPQLAYRQQVSEVYICCCIVHNVILMHDGLDNMWESEVNWKRLLTLGLAYEQLKMSNSSDDNVDDDEEVYKIEGAEEYSSFVVDAAGFTLKKFRHYDEGQQFRKQQSVIANHLQYT